MGQFFKGDALEQKVYRSGVVPLNNIALELEAFWNGIYNCVPMGELLWDNNLVPMTNAIRRDIFTNSFAEIFTAWQFCGTFESYILVFKKIFGDDTTIEFTVPDPGKLHIDIEASGVQLYEFVSRVIVNNAFVYDNMVTHEGDNICFATVQGFETEAELMTALYTLVPNGIYTTVSLTIGP